jgi:protoporphyrinogen IX oxidase
MIVLLKFLHVAAISLWTAGLVSLPALYVQRASVADRDALHRLQKIVRFSYVTIVSPAAFVAVMSGTGLIFLRQVYAPWFSVKMMCVGALVILHVLTGLVIIRLFREGEIYPVWRFLMVTVVTCGIVAAILIIVLAKPEIDVAMADVITRPGGLRSLIQSLSPWPIP